MPDRKFDQHVSSLTIRDSSTDQAGLGLLCSDVSSLDNRSAWIQHGSTDASGDLLSGNIQSCQKSHQEQSQRFRARHASPHLSSRIAIDFAKQSLVERFGERAREFAHRLKCGDYRDASQQVNNLKAVLASIAK